ncbi:MAG: oligosaccharide flippase family protein, partial [Muribaculaceae bacterium]|nr:oligosaccharide flippase family protein [Muribaculaceae bacterium]
MKNSLTGKVLKAIGVFSGAEALGIICSVVKMKLVALWLGAAGVGLFGIFNNSLETISILTGLGLRQSGVREVARHSNTPGALQRIVRSLRGWCALSGGLGALIVCAMAPWLSEFFFGDFDYWWQFMILAGALLFNSVVGGEQAILQGTRRIRKLANASVGGAVSGLAISIPMFRFMGERSVVFSIIAYGVSQLFFLYLFRNKELKYALPDREEFSEGRELA